MQAHETGDTSGLEFARSPQFGQVALAMAKIMVGVNSGPAAPVVPKGAEVESAATGAKTKPAGPRSRLAHLTKEEREEARRFGITEDEIAEAEALKAKVGAL